MSAPRKIKPVLFIVLLAGISSWLCLRYADRTVDSIYISSDDVKLTLRGEIPAHTKLQISAKYGSSSCAGEDLLQSEEADDGYRSISTLTRTFSEAEKSHPYQVDFPLDNFGKCAWQLQSINWRFIWYFAPPRMVIVDSPFNIEPCTSDGQINLQPCRRNNALRPVIYTLRHESDAGSWDGLISIDSSGALAFKSVENARWQSRQPGTLSVDVNKKVAVNLTLALKPDYVVRLRENVDGRESTVIYPDGTTWFYATSLKASPPAGAHTGEQMTLYSPWRKESCLNTLQQSAKGGQKDPMRENDYCR
ncbi:hypothetical protein [Pseudocitrobacter cyperus]|uniref:Uncharacterized protein n=1 Tax=Pseudocitrobacter cyperus TaxID=3112843 RepID=A0ABV0HEF9_9ENTR